ncbi:MAG: hypothetical protein F6J89_26665 [Symploca sp. SIO1C4]|uniref:Uncharacterized protein n=1 Tax=Symploca sp. SIO1C4 TaxID=2607765 RepID=A0A6B3NLM7_9CYAN|nr:hypothetical protein [Symploca sp. SIO1C4]NET07102.1 hypothetical protein [Symploca sp. SIO2B6]
MNSNDRADNNSKYQDYWLGTLYVVEVSCFEVMDPIYIIYADDVADRLKT